MRGQINTLGPTCSAKACFMVFGNITTTTVNKGRQAGSISSLCKWDVYDLLRKHFKAKSTVWMSYDSLCHRWRSWYKLWHDFTNWGRWRYESLCWYFFILRNFLNVIGDFSLTSNESYLRSSVLDHSDNQSRRAKLDESISKPSVKFVKTHLIEKDNNSFGYDRSLFSNLI